MELFRLNRVAVNAYCDLVYVTLGDRTLRLFYQTTLEIAAGMRLAAKMSMRHEGALVTQWRETLQSIPTSGLPRPEFYRRAHKTFRRSNLLANVSVWRVTWSGALVSLHADDVVFRLHWTDALVLHRVLREWAKDAKSWAGDTSRTTRSVAYLSDAEENYKYGYNK